MSQSILDFGHASSAAKSAANRHHKKRQQHTVSQLQIQNQVRSQRKTRIRWQQDQSVPLRCQNQPPTPHNPLQYTLEGQNTMHNVSNQGSNFGFIRTQDPTLQRPTFDIFNTHSRSKQGLTALTRNLRKSEANRQYNEWDRIEEWYDKLA